MRQPYLFIVLALLITMILILYNYLGGFNEPVLSYEPVEVYRMTGKNYSGRLDDPQVEILFNEMKAMKSDRGYQGPLVMVWFMEPEVQKDSVGLFIGIELLPGDAPPEELDLIEIEMDGLIRATLSGHPSVLPAPSSVTEKIRAYAQEHQYPLQDLVIDKYPSDSLVFTEMPVRKMTD